MRAPWIDLAARSLGGGVVAANDDAFGEKENLVVDAPAAFVPGRYGHAGEIVDGWETRRRRDGPGRDWAIVRLGARGVIRSVDVDTTSFTGNHPPRARVEAIAVGGYPDPAALAASTGWRVVVPDSDLRGDAHNTFAVDDGGLATHVRLTIEPDGGVARLRVLGDAVPDPALVEGLTVDLLARRLGGVLLQGSDAFYGGADSLNAPGPARTMGEGWETRRRRDGGHDWAVFRLAAPGHVRVVEVDTTWFVHNASREVALWGCLPAPGTPPPDPAAPDGWVPLLPRTRLQPDTRHLFRRDGLPEVSHVRLDAFPDGGLARLRLHGSISQTGLAILPPTPPPTLP